MNIGAEGTLVRGKSVPGLQNGPAGHLHPQDLGGGKELPIHAHGVGQPLQVAVVKPSHPLRISKNLVLTIS